MNCDYNYYFEREVHSDINVTVTSENGCTGDDVFAVIRCVCENQEE